jgi:Flp pilus assembly protein TadD
MARRYRWVLLAMIVWALPAEALAQAAPPLDSLTVEQLQERGDTYRLHRQYADAADCYRAALVKTPQDSRLWNRLGMAHLQLRQLKEAKKEFSQATRFDSGYAEAVNNLGVAYYFEKNYKKAIRQYERAIRLRENSASFHNNLAGALFARKRVTEAYTEYARAFELDPQIFERTATGGESAQLQSPEDRALWTYLVAKLYARRGDTEQALSFLRKAVEEGYKDLKKVYTDEEFAQVRQDPRFAEIMKRTPPEL